MKQIILAILLLSAAGSCDAAISEWNEKDKKLYTSYILLNAVDTMQTFDLIDCQQRYYLHGIPCTVHEANPLWGNPPEKGTVIMVKIGSHLLTTYFMDRMEDRDRRITLKWLNIIGGAVVVNNHSKGLHWSIKF